MADKVDLKKEVAAYLKGKDVKKLTVRKVKTELEEKLGDLSSRKKELDDIIAQQLKSIKNGTDEDDDDDAEEEEEEQGGKRKKGGKKGAAKKKKDDDDDEGSEDEDAGEAKGKKGAAAKGGKPNRLNKSCKLSPELAEFLGEDALPRSEVVKRMWAIIKERNMYDPKNKQFAICDDKLQEIIGSKRFRIFGMMKYLKKHFV